MFDALTLNEKNYKPVDYDYGIWQRVAAKATTIKIQLLRIYKFDEGYGVTVAHSYRESRFIFITCGNVCE